MTAALVSRKSDRMAKQKHHRPPQETPQSVPVVIPPAVRQFRTPKCPVCPSEDTFRYAQEALDGGRVKKYCKCKRCGWTWTAIFRLPTLGGE